MAQFDFFGRNLFKNHAAIVAVDILRSKILEGIDFGQFGNIFLRVDKDWLDDMMFSIADVAERENFLIARAV